MRVIKSGFLRGKQRYKCKVCNYRFVGERTHGYPEKVKVMAYLLYLEGMGFRRIGRVLNVSNVSVMKWIKSLAASFEHTRVAPRHCEVIELDEMWHFVQKKREKSGCGWLWIELPKNCWAGQSVVVGKKP